MEKALKGGATFIQLREKNLGEEEFLAEAKEIARLQRELRDTKDALEVLKKAIGILGK